MADSPDAICSATDKSGIMKKFAVEVKTMTAPQTIENALALAEKFGQYSIMSNVGFDLNSNALFRDLVPKTQYRA